MGEADRPRAAWVSAVAALDEPTRRRLYDYVVRQPAPVSRDEAADAVRAPRTTVAFHLDKLVAEGLLEVVHERRTGRSGPGAGRPSKLYRRSPEHIVVSLPERRYELVALLLADAVHEAQTSGESPRTVLDRRARELGAQLGRQARAGKPGQDGRTVAAGALETFGFEPRTDDDDEIVLGNCPFHSMARQHPELVCGMNLCLLDGLLHGLAATGLTAHLEPAPGHCCVRITPSVNPPPEVVSAAMTTTHTLETAEVDLAYDVHGPLPTADGRPPLFMIGQPMDATGFSTLASLFPDRTVVTYDPRGLGRSTRKDGRVDNAPTVQAGDVHALIEAVGGGPVEMFASSGGAVTALALVAAHPNDVTTLVAHEPPLIPVLPDAAAAERARAGMREAYEAKGSGAGMATFFAMTSWRGEFTDDYFAQPPADPVQFGMPAEDDGSRDDPLLSDRSWPISSYRPDVDALAKAPTRIVIAVGEESQDTFTGRTSVATAELLGQEATVFPSHHGGFLGGEFGYAGQPEAFARKLREVLDGT